MKGLKTINKGHTNFYECCDLTKKVYLMYNTMPQPLLYHHNNKVGTMPKALAGSRLAMFNGLAVVILPQKPTWPFDTVHYPQYMVLTRKFARVLFQNPVYSLSNSQLKMFDRLGVSWDKSSLSINTLFKVCRGSRYAIIFLKSYKGIDEFIMIFL